MCALRATSDCRSVEIAIIGILKTAYVLIYGLYYRSFWKEGLMQGGPVFVAQRFVDWERRWCLLFLAFVLTFVKVWMIIFFTDYLMECSRLL